MARAPARTRVSPVRARLRTSPRARGAAPMAGSCHRDATRHESSVPDRQVGGLAGSPARVTAQRGHADGGTGGSSADGPGAGLTAGYLVTPLAAASVRQ